MRNNFFIHWNVWKRFPEKTPKCYPPFKNKTDFLLNSTPNQSSNKYGTTKNIGIKSAKMTYQKITTHETRYKISFGGGTPPPPKIA